MTNIFANQVTYAVGTYPTGIGVQDVNGDVKPYVIITNFSSATISVLLNIYPFPNTTTTTSTTFTTTDLPSTTLGTTTSTITTTQATTTSTTTIIDKSTASITLSTSTSFNVSNELSTITPTAVGATSTNHDSTATIIGGVIGKVALVAPVAGYMIYKHYHNSISILPDLSGDGGTADMVDMGDYVAKLQHTNTPVHDNLGLYMNPVYGGQTQHSTVAYDGFGSNQVYVSQDGQAWNMADEPHDGTAA